MRQAIMEVFEAGFQGLEAMIMSLQTGFHAPSTAAMPSIGTLRAGPGNRGALGEIQQNMANLHLKHSSSMPVHLYNPMPAPEYPTASRLVSSCLLAQIVLVSMIPSYDGLKSARWLHHSQCVSKEVPITACVLV